MGSVSNRVVKRKKKQVTRKSKPRKRTPKNANPRVVGFDNGKFAVDVLNHRNAARLTQRELAKQVGLTSTAIVFIENARCNMLVGNFAKLAQFFKLNPTDYIPT